MAKLNVNGMRMYNLLTGQGEEGELGVGGGGRVVNNNNTIHYRFVTARNHSDPPLASRNPIPGLEPLVG